MSDRSDFIKKFKVGGIYWFINPKISSLEPHPHVCIGTHDDNYAFMFCGTSQFERKRKYFEYSGLPFETLVRIQSNVTNTITKDTYINCNEIQTHTLDELYNNPTFSLKGEISEAELYQIKNGIEISELIEEELKTLILKNFPEI